MAPEQRSISVVYALAERQEIVKLTVPATTTIAEAVERSGLPARFPEIAALPLNCAVYARVVELTSVVGEGDRIEILRPLVIDPKENRRQAAAAAKRKT
jgi:putative ubiquitin-RnfH superfamily antitoxin RatB of RatAB toxin-antitoxin module